MVSAVLRSIVFWRKAAQAAALFVEEREGDLVGFGSKYLTCAFISFI
jgi:hypothetical protein